MRYILTLFLFSHIVSFAQKDWNDFSREERAFMFHEARKTSLLKEGALNLFEFQDSIPYINDTLPDYRYVESEIMRDPDLLIFHSDQVNRKSVGLVSDLCVRLALRELGQVLHYRNSSDPKDAELKEKLKVFEKYVLEEIPQSAVRTLNNGDYTLVRDLQGYYAQSLTIGDKMAAIINSGYSENDQMLILNSIMDAEEKYVNNRAKDFMNALGAEHSGMNLLSAVGDGRNWADIKGGFATPYTIGLPDENGIFSFNVALKTDERTKYVSLKTDDVVSHQFNTESGAQTTIHVDVFGYHPERQTTIAIQRGGSSYLLYGKNEHRLVSPDSSYGEGVTYWRLIDRLENFYIANLKEDLYGKRGYEYQIDLFEKKIEKTRLQIKKTEYRLDQIRYDPKSKTTIKKKKNKKKNRGYSDSDGKGHPTGPMTKAEKKRNIEQNRLVQLNGQLDGQKSILKKLKEDMEEAYENLIKYEKKLDFMKKNMGYSIIGYEEIGDYYIFDDGATFNYRSQDFSFPSDKEATVFQLIHISFGKEVFTDQIDENFVHFNISAREEGNTYVMRKVQKDRNPKGISVSDSLQIQEFFNYLLRYDDVKLETELIAGGIALESGTDFSRDRDNRAEPYDSEGETNNGAVIYEVFFDAAMRLKIHVYEDDMLPSNWSEYANNYAKFKAKYPELNEIDFLTAKRTLIELEKWKQLLETKAKSWISDSRERQIVLKKISKLKVKTVTFEANGKTIKSSKL